MYPDVRAFAHPEEGPPADRSKLRKEILAIATRHRASNIRVFGSVARGNVEGIAPSIS